MADKSEEKQENAFEKMQELAKKLLKVPKNEVEREERKRGALKNEDKS